MPDPISHTAGALAALTAGIAFVFDVPSAVILAAFSGSCLGVAVSRKSAYSHALFLVTAGTVAAGFCVPLLQKFFLVKFSMDMPLRGLAFAMALLMIWDTSRGLAISTARRFMGGLFGGSAK